MYVYVFIYAVYCVHLQLFVFKIKLLLQLLPPNACVATKFRAKLATPLSFGTLAFQNGLEDRKSDLRILNDKN